MLTFKTSGKIPYADSVAPDQGFIDLSVDSVAVRSDCADV